MRAVLVAIDDERRAEFRGERRERAASLRALLERAWVVAKEKVDLAAAGEALKSGPLARKAFELESSNINVSRVVAPIVGTGVLWTVVFAAIFFGRGELVGRRLFVVALLVVAGSTLVGATR